MKLGEIKIQVLELIFPSSELEYEESNLNEMLFNLRSSPSYGAYLSASVGSINRALSIIESRSTRRIKRISHTTPNDYELELEDKLAQIIPYFVKSDLLLSESPEESKVAQELFERLLAQALDESTSHSETIYSQRELLG